MQRDFKISFYRGFFLTNVENNYIIELVCTFRKWGVEMDILKTVDEFKNNCQKIIADFSVIDENDPITPLKLNNINEIIDTWMGILKANFIKHDTFVKDFNLAKNNYRETYEKEIRILNNSLNSNIKSITNNHVLACQKMKKKIEIEKTLTKNTIEQLELDNEYFVTTSDQKIELLNDDFNQAKKRFDYQKEEAKESYLEIVKKNNYILEEIRVNLLNAFNKETSTFLEENTNIRNKLQELIDSKTIELNSLIKALENEKNNMKEKYRQESANLNESIKKIAIEKNKTIDKAKSQYSRAISDANIEKENKKQTYQTKSQALLKAFVTKINEIDEDTNAKKKEFQEVTLKVKRDYYSKKFEQTRLFHNQIEQIYKACSSSTIDKYTANLIKFKNKEYSAKIYAIKLENELNLLELTRAYTIKINENRNNKNYLEIDKNHSMKKINSHEQFDNKFYQEKNSIFENDLNYIVKTTNYRFAQKANLLRCQSQIRTKLLERNYDGIEANYYKKIEAIQNHISAYKLEIDLTDKLRSLVTEYQEKSYLNNLHREEVNNLLEIEKNKLLKEFNGALYDYNLRIITLAKDYGLKKISIENEKFAKEKDQNITLQNLLLDKSSVFVAFSIKKEQQLEKFSKIRTQVLNNHDLKVTKEIYINNLKSNDLSYLKSLLESYNDFVESFKRNFKTIVGIIIKDLYPTNENIHYLESLINLFSSLFIDLFVEVLKSIEDSINECLDNQIEFIHQFKYKSSLDNIKNSYLEFQLNIKEQKNVILDKIDSNSKTIENFKQKIYTLVNDNEMLLQDNHNKKRKLDSLNQVAYKETELKIKDYREKIDNFIQMNKMHNDDLSELNKKIYSNTVTYNKEYKKILKMQNDDTYVYQCYKKNLLNIDISLAKLLTSFKQTKFLECQSNKQFYKSVDRSFKKLDLLSRLTKYALDESYKKFDMKIKDESDKNKAFISKEYQVSSKKFTRNSAKEEKSYKNEYRSAIDVQVQRVNKHKKIMNQTTQHYEKLLEEANENFLNESNNIEIINKRITDNFFTSYYALDDNNQKIKDYHKNQKTLLDTKFKNDKYQAVQKNLNEKLVQNNKYKAVLKNKNEEIDHLPIAFKYNSRILNKETKKRNMDLHNDIKQAKVDFNLQRKQVEKAITALKSQLEQEIKDNEFNQKQNITAEKKRNHKELRQSLKAISIKL